MPQIEKERKQSQKPIIKLVHELTFEEFLVNTPDEIKKNINEGILPITFKQGRKNPQPATIEFKSQNDEVRRTQGFSLNSDNISFSLESCAVVFDPEFGSITFVEPSGPEGN